MDFSGAAVCRRQTGYIVIYFTIYHGEMQPLRRILRLVMQKNYIKSCPAARELRRDIVSVSPRTLVVRRQVRGPVFSQMREAHLLRGTLQNRLH